jgi:hypothetical protein
MKNSIVVFSFLLTIGLNAQNIKLPTNFDNEITYSDVVEISGLSKDSILKNANLHLKKDENVSDLKIEDGKITCKGYEDFIGGQKKIKMKMTFDITIEFKEGKYKYIIDNVVYRPYPDAMSPEPMPINADKLYKEYRDLIAEGKENNKVVKNSQVMFAITDREIKEFITELEKGIKEPSKDEDDW